MKVGQVVKLVDDVHYNANWLDPYGPSEHCIIFKGAQGRIVHIDSDGRGADVEFFGITEPDEDEDAALHWVEIEKLKEVKP